MLFFMSEEQFNDLFTLKNAHLSSNSYNSWTQPNILIKFAGYVALIFLYKCCKFGEKICNNSRDIEFFLGDYFFSGAPCTPHSKNNATHKWLSAPVHRWCNVIFYYDTLEKDVTVYAW